MVTTKSFPKATSNIVAIPFDKDKGISTEQLMKRCVDAELINEFHFPSIKFIQYRNHQLVLKCTFFTGDYDVKFKASEKELQVTCSCKGKHPGVCIHICKTVAVIVSRYGKCYFAQLLPNRQFDLAFKYQFGFDKIETESGIYLMQRKEVMQLFPFDKPNFPLALDDILSLKVPSEKKMPEKREAVAFLLMLPYAGKQPPFIVPAFGKMSKSNDRITSWTKFLPVLDEEAEKSISVHQLDLVIKGSQVRERSEEFGKENNYSRMPKWNEKMLAAFNEWKNIYPLLQNEVFVYSYTYFGIRAMRMRPSKSHASRITVSVEKPEVYFKLVYTKERFQLTMGIKINGRPLSSFDAHYPFFVIHQGTLYMFDTYQDAAIAQWMVNAGHITIYNEHKKEATEAIIKPLAERYRLL